MPLHEFVKNFFNIALTISLYLAILPNRKGSDIVPKTASMRGTNIPLLQAKARVFKALGHPTRLYIVTKLSKGECCVCAFADSIDADLSTVSKHLSVLKQAGIVEDEKRGLQVFYRLKIPCVLNFMECVEDAIKSSVDAQVEMLK